MKNQDNTTQTDLDLANIDILKSRLAGAVGTMRYFERKGNHLAAAAWRGQAQQLAFRIMSVRLRYIRFSRLSPNSLAGLATAKTASDLQNYTDNSLKGI